jgi:hypothetical protein
VLDFEGPFRVARSAVALARAATIAARYGETVLLPVTGVGFVSTPLNLSLFAQNDRPATCDLSGSWVQASIPNAGMTITQAASGGLAASSVGTPVGWASASGAITLGSGSFYMRFSNGAHVNGQVVAPACNSIAWSNGNTWQRVGPGALVRPHFWVEDAVRAPNARTVNFTYVGAGPTNVPMGPRNIVTLSWTLFGPRLPLAALRASLLRVLALKGHALLTSSSSAAASASSAASAPPLFTTGRGAALKDRRDLAGREGEGRRRAAAGPARPRRRAARRWRRPCARAGARARLDRPGRRFRRSRGRWRGRVR